jgi:type VI secretion system protein ImpK
VPGYVALRTSLGRTSEARMHVYNDVVEMAPRAANLTITLP